MYQIDFANRARRAVKKLSRSGNFDTEKVGTVINMLRDGVTLPPSYEDHQLQGEMSNLRECHLAFDLLLVYRRNETLKTITITNIGTHDELFG